MGDLEPAFANAVERLRDSLARRPVSWALTGSTSFALQGVPVEPDDIDVQTTETGAYAIEAVFSSQVVASVSEPSGERVRSHFGGLSMNGGSVQLMGALRKRRSDGSWFPPVDIESHRDFVSFRGGPVPVLSLPSEAEAYEQLGRSERAALLRDHLD